MFSFVLNVSFLEEDATLANKTSRQRKSGKIQNAYADKTCENTIKKLLPYGN